MDKIKKVKLFMGLGVAALLILIGPLLWMLLQAGLALSLVGALGVAMAGAIRLLPLAGQKLENKILELRKAEARKNPIEQKQNELLRRRKQIEMAKKALVGAGSQIEGMEDMIREQARKDPDCDMSQERRGLEKMKAFYQGNLEKLRYREGKIAEFAKNIERDIFKWEFTQKGKATIEGLNVNDQESVLNEILTSEANRAVNDEFNQICAEMDMEVSTMNAQGVITYEGGLTLDMTGYKVPEMAKVN